MNIHEADIIKQLNEHPFVNQRILAESTGYSLGTVNHSIKSLVSDGYLDKDYSLTSKARETFKNSRPRNAIILAAGFGMRMVPINMTTPKAMLEVNNERLIERMIGQLHESGIDDITVVVGFMKESFEYLIDKYNVKLIVNPEYSRKNNLCSLLLAVDDISDTYIIPSDIWCRYNPFSKHELYSWYMVSDKEDPESEVRVNRKRELVRVALAEKGNSMIGISYLTRNDAKVIRENIMDAASSGLHDNDFWEIALYQSDRMMIPARLVAGRDVLEINTYEQLREVDENSDQLQSDALDLIANVFHTDPGQVVDISVLKKGMTNRSFLFTVGSKKYIMRIPGEGTDMLIDRRHEARVFETISGRGLCDDPVYINPANGYKITAYLDGVRVCDPGDLSDVRICMKKLKKFHDMKLVVDHRFDIFGQIDFYENLWAGRPSVYEDYKQTKEHVLKLKGFIDSMDKELCLTHIDAVPDNFLFYKTDEKAEEEVQLTDWEYSGMQDPHVDIAMFAIYSLYDREEVDRLIDMYFEDGCDHMTRLKIYAYISACGLLWSNWCEYKSGFGVEFGEYSLRQYRYAKDYYRYLADERVPGLK
ncbi:NTP transferase domain-containing protein [Butyrivibrio sp. MC2013]|uniref:NTP transferase domain-containing protein n=1 Tax=Butyrivibrio sp. MC2013 TaxID=1280686 RepID=UPI00047B78C1|nr:NTP transferase domain-containing protein [Butyrivibrio sp. MC2013]